MSTRPSVLIPACVLAAACVPLAPAATAATILSAGRVLETYASATHDGKTHHDPKFASSEETGHYSEFILSRSIVGEAEAQSSATQFSNISPGAMTLHFNEQASVNALKPDAANAGGFNRYTVEFELTETEFWSISYAAHVLPPVQEYGVVTLLSLYSYQTGAPILWLLSITDLVYARALTLPPGRYELDVEATADIDALFFPDGAHASTTDLTFRRRSGPCPGDVEGNGVVDFGDLNAVLSAFGATTPPPATAGAPGTTGSTGGNLFPIPGDLNDDGVVNFLDLNIVLSYYASECPE